MNDCIQYGFYAVTITEEANLYITFNNEIGRQFFNNYLDLFGLGMQVIIHCFCVMDKVPFLYPSFKDLRIKCPKSSQKNLKNSTVISGTFRIFHIF